MKPANILKYETLIILAILIASFTPLHAQVHYKKDSKPWINRTTKGPDAAVPGWFYNLGVTGIRAQWDPVNLKALQVKYVFKKSAAYKKNSFRGFDRWSQW